MTRTSLSRLLSLGLLGALLTLDPPAPAQTATPLDWKASYEKLLSSRNALLSDLEARHARSGKPLQQLRLRLAAGADTRDAYVTLRHVDGQWAASGGAEVPAWAPGTMQEWRGFFLANGAGTAWRNNLRYTVDPSALAFDGSKLAGPLPVHYKLDQTLDEQFPPGEVATWWDKFIPTGHAIPRPQTYTIDAAVDKDACLLDMVLPGGVRWTPKEKPADAKTESKPGKVGKPPKPPQPPTIRPIFVRLQVPSSRFSTAQVSTPTWNGGFHEADATGLAYKDGKLSGTLVVYLHQDGWIPYGGGKTYQAPPLVAKFKIGATLTHNELTGTYDASGDMGEYSGGVSGTGGKLITGRYAATGKLGPAAGMLDGVLYDQFLPPRQVLGQDLVAPTNAREAADRAGRLLVQIRALHMALQHYPLPLREALLQADTCDAAAHLATPEQAAVYCAESEKTVSRLSAPDTKLPAPRPEDTGESWSSGVVPAGVDGTANVLGGAGWQFLKQWQLLGSFEQRVGIENNDSLVPEVVVVPGMSYVQPVDRLGAIRTDAPAKQWAAVTCESPRIAMPGEEPGFYTRFVGQQWYAASVLKTDAARKAWLSLESGDHAKLWLNGKLVWADAEKPWRHRERSRVIVPVDLQAGENHLLARVRRDREPGWLRLAISPTEPAAPVEQPKAAKELAAVEPPLAWDIEAGINVAWRNQDLPGSSQPLPVGGLLLVTSAPQSLHAVDAGTGKVKWTVTGAAEMPKDPKAPEARVSDPAWDGKNAFFHSSLGVTICTGMTGKTLWSAATHLGRAQVHVSGDALVLEGDVTPAWKLPDELADVKVIKGKLPVTGVLILDRASGKERASLTIRGGFQHGWSRMLPLQSPQTLMTSTGVLVDVGSGKVAGRLDVETPGASDESYQKSAQIIGPRWGRAFGLSSNSDTIFMTTQAQNSAVRFWRGPDGKAAFSHACESNYEHGGFGSFVAPSAATDKLVFSWMPVLERGPHCPDARLELHAQDARTGRPLARLKPALSNAVAHEVSPVVAGGYVFCTDMGGGSHGGVGYGQVAVATADERLQLVARNRVDLGTKTPPVFEGDRLFLRSSKALTCIAVTGAAGKKYQDEQVASTLLRDLGLPPTTATPREIEPLAKAPANVPIGPLVDGRTTEFWLGAGPMKASPDAAALAGLRPSAGEEVSLGGAKVTFAPLSREHAWNDPPLYRRDYILQGTGDIVPTFSSKVDPRAVSSAEGSGLLYTVLDNNRDRIVVPSLKAAGVTMFLAGEQIRADEPLHLKPGLYPLLVKVDPAYYASTKREEIPPVAVSKALAAGALKDIAWPGTWKVVGPLPGDAAPLEGEDLKRPPEKITIGEQEFVPYDFKADNGALNLVALLTAAPGQKPDPASAPKGLKIGAPATAYVFGSIDAPAEGTLYISAAADWYMKWYVDGELVYDTSKGGNAAAATDSAAHPFAVRVSKGKHAVTAQVMPGTGGWSLVSVAGFAEKASPELAAFGVASKAPKAAPEVTFAPAFRELPHPPTRLATWLGRVSGNRARLEAIVRDLPGSEEAKLAATMLGKLAK